MTVSDEELQAKRDRNQELRDAIAQATQTAEDAARERENEITARLLDAEGDKLEAELEAIHAAQEAADGDGIPDTLGLPNTPPVNGTPVSDQGGDSASNPPPSSPETVEGAAVRDDLSGDDFNGKE